MWLHVFIAIVMMVPTGDALKHDVGTNFRCGVKVKEEDRVWLKFTSAAPLCPETKMS